MSELEFLGDVHADGRHRWSQADLDDAPAAARVDDLSSVAPGRQGRGVLFRWLLSEARPGDGARYACLESSDGSFAASIELADLEHAIVVHAGDGGPLTPEQGGPFRFLGPGATDACGNIKQLGRVTLGATPDRDTRPPVEERTC